MACYKQIPRKIKQGLCRSSVVRTFGKNQDARENRSGEKPTSTTGVRKGTECAELVVLIIQRHFGGRWLNSIICSVLSAQVIPALGVPVQPAPGTEPFFSESEVASQHLSKS